jgi:hypothetical protein
MNDSAPLPVARCKNATSSFLFFTFQFFSLKKKLKDAGESDIFPTGVRTSEQRINYEW